MRLQALVFLLRLAQGYGVDHGDFLKVVGVIVVWSVGGGLDCVEVVVVI